MLGYLLLAALAGYLLGSLPFGWMIARLNGVDIFSVGSRSARATNVGRAVGATARNFVFALDAAKGAVAGAWPLCFSWPAAQSSFPHDAASMKAVALVQVLGLVSLACALVGHSFSCFTKFRGGKGVATGAGGFLVLLPVPTLISAGVWLGVYFLTRYVSLASICSAAALPLAALVLGGKPPLLTEAAAAVGIFVIVRHRANIARLLAGTESKGGRRD